VPGALSNSLNSSRLQRFVRTIAAMTAGALCYAAAGVDWELMPWEGVRFLAEAGIMLVIALAGPLSKTGALLIVAMMTIFVMSTLLD
jgi:hypothetical protein